VAQKVISPSQAGFMPAHSAEDHVLTLLESAKWCHRQAPRQALYVLFLDFKQAYDSVHPAALFAVLRRMGLPEDLVALLEFCSAQRRTRIAVNGERSEEMPMLMGVGQGDVLSPLLFNIFIESLSRHLATAGDVHGVTVAGVHLRDLKYADDVAILCASPQQVQRAIVAVRRWTDAWGMQLGIGNLKTQAMALPPPTRGGNTTRAAAARAFHQGLPRLWQPRATGAPALTPPPAPVDPFEFVDELSMEEDATLPCIQWVDEYKYLGYWLRPDLSDKGLVQKVVANLEGNWKRYFAANEFVRDASAAFALQVYRTVLQGANNYLLALAEPTAATRRIMDQHSEAVIRRCVKFTAQAPLAALWAEGKLMRASGIMARERMRLLLKVRHLAAGGPDALFPDSILGRLYTAVWAERPAAAPVRPCRSYSWFWRAADLADKMRRDLDVDPVTWLPRRLDINKVAGVYGRAVAFAEWQESARVDLATAPAAWPPPGPDSVRAAWPMAFCRPPAGPPKRVAAWFAEDYLVPTDALGDVKASTPFSVRGPGGSGCTLAAISASMSATKLFVLSNLALGRLALFLTGGPLHGTEPPEAAAVHAHCRHCGLGLEDPWHIATTCQYSPVVAVRDALWADLPRKAREIASGLAAACSPRIGEEDDVAIALRDAVDDAFQQRAHNPWHAADDSFVLFRLLSARPWRAVWASPAGSAGPPAPGFERTATLGALFDYMLVKQHRLRHVQNSWAIWAGCWTQRIFAAWKPLNAPPAAPG
jgi:hypothetical protein